VAMRVGAIGYYLPEEVTNDELLARVAAGSGPGVDLKRLERKLILNEAETRCFIGQEETAVDMAEKAARRCLERSGCQAQDIDLILYAGMKREYVEPAMSVLLQDRLGAKNANAFDLSNACLGFLNAMEVAKLYIDSGRYQKILVVSAETGSEWIPWDKFTGESEMAGFSALTVSDAAAAMLLEEGGDEKSFGLFEFKTFGEYHDLCQIRIGKGGDDLKLLVESRQLAITAIEILSEFIPRFLHKAIEHSGGLDIWFPHQVTGNPKRFFGKLEDELHDICYNSFSKVGNTGSLSIPLGMALAEEEGALKRGDKVALIVGASGFSYGGACLVY